jgi:hypothetical protein
VETKIPTSSCCPSLRSQGLRLNKPKHHGLMLFWCEFMNRPNNKNTPTPPLLPANSQKLRKKKIMGFGKDELDLVLVPCGLMIMFAYHLHLLHRYLRCPATTFIGYENNDKKAWVESIMKASISNPSSSSSSFIFLGRSRQILLTYFFGNCRIKTRML